MADLLLKVGRSSGPEADGEELGDGTTTFGVIAGDGIVAAGVVPGVEDGAVSGVTVGFGVVVGAVSGVAVGEVTGVISGVAGSSGVDVGLGVVKGAAVAVGIEAAVALDTGDGELVGCPAEGAAGCCSQPAKKKLAKAAAATKHLII